VKPKIEPKQEIVDTPLRRAAEAFEEPCPSFQGARSKE